MLENERVTIQRKTSYSQAMDFCLFRDVESISLPEKSIHLIGNSMEKTQGFLYPEALFSLSIFMEKPGDFIGV